MPPSTTAVIVTPATDRSQSNQGQRRKESGKRVSIKNATTKPIEQDPWHDVQVDWLNVLINVGTFLLLVTEVPRSGAITHLSMRELSPGVYSWVGSYAYEVITFARQPLNISNLTATLYDAEVDSARTWSYTYDTTSLQLRTITSGFNAAASAGNHALQCMNYERSCDVTSTFTLVDAFSVLEQIVNHVASIPHSSLPAVYPPSTCHEYQSLRVAKQIKSRFVFVLYDKLIDWFLKVVRSHWVRISHWPRIDPLIDVCADPRDRPFLCDAGEISDYTYTADPTHAESASVTFIWDSINHRARTILAEFQNATSNIHVDITVLESYTEPVMYAGGWVTGASDEFTIVVITRVRDCPTGFDGSVSEPCRTIRLVDYRYEGALLHTNVRDWDTLVLLLRISAQIYCIIRVFALFLGCYLAVPQTKRSWRHAVFLAFSEVPGDVVVYGSIFPVAVYSFAAMIDGPAVSSTIHLASLKLQGTFLTNPKEVYTLICALMRKQWHMALVVKLWIRSQTLSRIFNRHNGIVSVRGHIFGILASISMIVGYYHPGFRDTRVLGFIEASPSNSVTFVRTQTRDSAHRWYGGIYCDVFSITLSVLLYTGMASVLQRLSRWFPMLFGTKVSQIRISPHDDFKMIMHRGMLFCRTDMLPSTCNTLWGVDGLTCGWGCDIILSLARRRKDMVFMVSNTRRSIVMNIVQLSDPWNYLKLRLGLNVHEVYTYKQVDKQTTFTVVNKLDLDPVFMQEIQSAEFLVVEVRPSNELGFHELVYIR